jgi:D-sedoheptulose 7-phosphate isomerase
MLIQKELTDHLSLAQRMHELEPQIQQACELIAGALRRGQRVFFCGNGGSAADAQHLAAELTGRFRRERPSLPGIALTTDTSALTAIANDYGFEDVFVRQLSGLSQPGDVLVGITTSGHSPNVLRALEWAKTNNRTTIGLLGKDGGPAKDLCDCALVVPHDDTARIQEMHILIGHIVCAWVEEEFGR